MLIDGMTKFLTDSRPERRENAVRLAASSDLMELIPILQDMRDHDTEYRRVIRKHIGNGNYVDEERPMNSELATEAIEKILYNQPEMKLRRKLERDLRSNAQRLKVAETSLANDNQTDDERAFNEERVRLIREERDALTAAVDLLFELITIL